MAKKTQPENETVAGMQIVKKISNALFKDVEIGEKIAIAGIIRGLESKTSDKGEYTKFVGDFACKAGDQVTKSNTLYVPQVAEGIMKNGYFAAVEAAETDAKAVSCEFSFLIFKQESKASKTGYIWALETRKELTPETDRTLALLG